MKTRVYKVNGRLVRAGSKAQAVNHVARDTITAAVATQDDIIGAMQLGIKVEEAGKEPAAGGGGDETA